MGIGWGESVTRSPVDVQPDRASRVPGGTYANELLAGVLVALVLLGWVLSWRGVLGAAWAQVLLVQARK